MLAVMPPVARAHHSASMYDANKPLTLNGRIKQFRWVSPHAVVILTTDAEPGRESREWLIEMSSPGNMTHLGWTHSSLKAGQHVAIAVSPLRDGTPGGACRTVTFIDDGKTMNCGLGASILAAEKPNIR
jgi:hypothetical protein